MDAGEVLGCVSMYQGLPGPLGWKRGNGFELRTDPCHPYHLADRDRGPTAAAGPFPGCHPHSYVPYYMLHPSEVRGGGTASPCPPLPLPFLPLLPRQTPCLPGPWFQGTAKP